jgi:site-specific DNA-methyltransferase (adenine-specific)
MGGAQDVVRPLGAGVESGAVRGESLAEGITLYLGDCREILPSLSPVDAVITDPPYEAVMQDRWGVLSRNAPSSHVRHETLGFDSIDHMRDDVARAVKAACRGWGVFFCMAEGVRAWRDAIEATGAKYKRAMVWVKPDAMPQFNGQGPSVGHEMMVSAWYGDGYSKWNGGGKPGVFHYCKNTPGGSQHPTQKPLPLISELVELFSFRGQTVCDPFMGSGTTGVAAVKLGRKFTGIEIDPTHFDVARARISEALRQPDLFVEIPQKKQEALSL